MGPACYFDSGRIGYTVILRRARRQSLAAADGHFTVRYSVFYDVVGFGRRSSAARIPLLRLRFLRRFRLSFQRGLVSAMDEGTSRIVGDRDISWPVPDAVAVCDRGLGCDNWSGSIRMRKVG